MIVKVDDEILFELTEAQKNVIKNDIKSEIFDEDIKRRLHWIIDRRYNQSYMALKKEWEPTLAERVESIPLNKDSFVDLVLAQPDYANKSARDSIAKELPNAD